MVKGQLLWVESTNFSLFYGNLQFSSLLEYVGIWVFQDILQHMGLYFHFGLVLLSSCLSLKLWDLFLQKWGWYNFLPITPKNIFIEECANPKFSNYLIASKLKSVDISSF